MTRKLRLLLLPVLAIGSAAVVMASGFGAPTADLPAAPAESARADQPASEGAGVSEWRETGIVRGKPGGANGAKSHAIRR